MKLSREFLNEYNYDTVTFDYYDEEKRKWFYKECDWEVAHFARHRISGKQYKINQSSRIIQHQINLKYSSK